MNRIDMSGMRALSVLASLLLALLCATPAFAQETTRAATHPAWEQLGTAERDLLTAPVRERWNSNPGERARMLEHARRWQAMTPEQRQRAHHGMKRWSHMDPDKRAEARALFGKMRHMSPEQRKVLREQWHAMTPEQRKAWIEANPPQPRR
uniref:DUF3106 domain-containing protein n=1 Tax=uncultured bacterium Lac36W TaxID=1403001 RepID=A0A059QB02_9BACT|nr:hypothetical protein [uncultured bacterium Lac36W]